MKPYEISVPVTCYNLGEGNLQKTKEELERMGAKRVFVAVSAFHTDERAEDKVLEDLSHAVDFFRESGFSVGVWTWSSMVFGEHSFCHKVNSEGKAHSTWICHADESFRRLVCRFVGKVARLGPEVILFDDDFKYSKDPTGLHGCFCPWHRKILKEKFGEELSLETIAQKAAEDMASPEGRIWQEVMAEGLEGYAREVRETVDRVNPTVRVGFCANLSGYGVEGTDALRLSRIFAGNTRPLVRAIGAPYWDWYEDYPRKLSEVLEVERHQAQLMKGSGVELLAEGDVYPRPRTAASAAYLEIFDSVLACNGGHDGILKYTLDYFSPADYERGYVDAHEKNRPLREALRGCFAEKPSVGVRVFFDPRILRESKKRFAFGGNPYEYTHSLLSTQSGRVLSRLGIPTTYEGEGVCVAALGEVARYLRAEDRKKGVITDLAGALALEEVGVDVGLAAVGEKLTVACEFFGEGQGSPVLDKDGYFVAKLKDKARVLSTYTSRSPFWQGEKPEEAPAAYCYENAEGERFLVLCFVATLAKDGFCSYHKGEQIRRVIPWLGGKALPAYCEKQPGAYLLCKEGEESLCVGLWNLSPDAMERPEVVLGEKGSAASFLGCEGRLSGECLVLSRLEPYGFCGAVIRKEKKKQEKN